MNKKETKLDIKTNWDLSPLLESEAFDVWNKKMELVQKENYKFINKWKDRKDYLEKAEILKEALDEYENLAANYGIYGDPGYYFYLKSTLETENKEIKAIMSKIDEMALKMGNDSEFFSLRLAKISKDKQKEFLANPLLKDNKHFLEQTFDSAKYLLSEAEEKILNLKSKTSHSNWVRMTSDFLSKEEGEIINEKGEKETKPYSEIGSFTYHKNKETRDSAVEALVKIYEKHEEVAENEFNSILYNKKVDDELRKAKRPDEISLVDDDIEPEVVDALIKAVTARYDIPHRFYALKAKLFNLDKLDYHERNLKYGAVDKEYTFEESVSLVYEVLDNLDKEFGDYFKYYIENGRFDALPKKGKRNGGFCISMTKSQPTYIFMNFTGRMFDISTIAHEMGHAINSELYQKQQNALNAGVSLATAEVASTFMEDFLIQRLEQDVDDETRLALMMTKLDDDIASIPRQISCYTFEQELHNTFREKGYLAKEEIEKLFVKHTMDYLGNSVKTNRLADLGWVGWPHLRSFFYVYSYASGLIISKALQHQVKENKEFISKVKEFLSTGSSMSPKDTFMKMGIDITNENFWLQGMDEIEDLLEKTENLAIKLGKI